MVIKCNNIFYVVPSNFTQIGIFGLKTNHLATLIPCSSRTGYQSNFKGNNESFSVVALAVDLLEDSGSVLGLHKSSF
jgi:hypothetical protein